MKYSIKMPDVDRDTLERILEQAEKLPSGDKATLIGKLLTTSELLVVLGSTHLSDSVVKQIGMMGVEELSEVMHAIAERIAGFGT